MKTLRHNTAACMDISTAAENLIDVAKREKALVVSDFNGVDLTATPSDNPKACVERWDAESFRVSTVRQKIAAMESELALLKSGAGL